MHHEHLYQFYGKSSTVVVSEMIEGGETMTETAEDEEVGLRRKRRVWS